MLHVVYPTLSAILFDIMLLFKSAHWQSEKEWRLVLGLTRREAMQRLSFRDGALGLIPYVIENISAVAGIFSNKVPLEKLMIGPSLHQELVAESVSLFLEPKGYWHTEIQVSGIPLRS